MENKLSAELLGNKITLVNTNARREYFESEPIQTIISTEVAEMMEMEHKNLIRKIEGINKDLVQLKFEPNKYWLESQYTASNGKMNRCYEITKKGCEFLAHKTNGTRGNLFTARYMDRFEEMENIIKSYVPQLSEKERLQLSILNGNDTERMDSLKRYELLLEEEISAPLLETIDNQDTVIDTIIPDSNLYDIGSVGRVLKTYTNGIMGEKKIFKYLQDNKILITSDCKQRHNSPYDYYSKYFKMKPVNKPNYAGLKTLFNGKGLKWFLKRLAEEGILEKNKIEEVEKIIIVEAKDGDK